MKNLSLLTVLLLMAIVSYSDSKISRGPNIGEIYFIGPTYTGLGLYYSTDFGQTAICVDSTFTNSIMSICADKTEGVVYYVTMGQGLYISYDYGNMNTWNLTSGGIKIFLNSGRNEGEIYSNISRKSIDYGQNFYYNTCNGYFGDVVDSEIDNLDNNGYSCVYSIYDPDTLFLLYSNDDCENFQIQKKFTNVLFNRTEMTRGFDSGEFYLNLKQFDLSVNWILKSIDFGQSFDTIDGLNINNFYQYDIVGGRQEGEIYLIYNFVNQLWLNAHIYIYHSTNYGKSFEVHHLYSKGDEPVLANFSSIDKELPITTPVEFLNFSIGDIQEFQWDFENDGNIDSYEESPIHTYPDTGWYSVRLNVVGADSTNSFVKHNYIHIIDTTTFIKEKKNTEISISPNPFDTDLYINIKNGNTNYKISIYNLQGKKVKEKKTQQSKTFKLSLFNIPPGIYLLNIKGQDKSTNYKIIKN